MGRLLLRRAGILAGALSAALLLSVGVQRAAAQATLVVDVDGFATATDCDDLVTPAFPTISAAVAAASSTGDTIKVCPGLYNEMVMINKNDLTILGAQAGVDARTRAVPLADESVINNSCGPVQMMADRIVLDGFIVQGSTMSDPCFLSGIWSNPGFSATNGGFQILNNIVQDNISGIELDSNCANATLVQFNLIQNNNNPGPGFGNGIQTNFGLCNATIDSNKFSGHTNSSFLVVTPSSSLNVTNNELVGGTLERIVFATVDTSTISGNVSIGSTTASGTIRLFGGNSSIDIANNTLRDGIRGIRVDDPFAIGANTNVDANFNCIDGNSIAGLHVDMDGHSGTLDAENNWWGSPSGPTHPSNSGGTGDAVIDPDGVVDFVPWLLSPTGTGPFCPPPEPPPPPPSFKATGGGQVDVGSRGTFGFNAKRDNGTSSGHLTYMNHSTGARLNCTVTEALVTSNTAEFSGTCSSNSSSSTFEAKVEDNDEPGKGMDEFEITYGATTDGGTIRAGNVQVHPVS